MGMCNDTERTACGEPLACFHRNLDAARSLSRRIAESSPQAIVASAMDTATVILAAIGKADPYIKRSLERFYMQVDRNIHDVDAVFFRKTELKAITNYCRLATTLRLRRLICAYKLMLSVPSGEHLLLDGILVYFSASYAKGERPEEDEKELSVVRRALAKYEEDLRQETALNAESRRFASFIRNRTENTEKKYSAQTEQRLEEMLRMLSRNERRSILEMRNGSWNHPVPEHRIAQPRSGYRFHFPLYSKSSPIARLAAEASKACPPLARKAGCLFLCARIMDAFRHEEAIYGRMKESIARFRMNMEGEASKASVKRSLCRLYHEIARTEDDAVCYQLETFFNAAADALDDGLGTLALRDDLSASLESNYHIQSPRKTAEILDYHLSVMDFVSRTVRDDRALLELCREIEETGNCFRENDEAPFRPDLTEIDVDHLLSGAVNVREAYREYLKCTRFPRPIPKELTKDSIDERLLQTDTIRDAIYSVLPEKEDIGAYESMGFVIRRG